MNDTNSNTLALIRQLRQLHEVARIVEVWASPEGAASMRRRADDLLRNAKEARP